VKGFTLIELVITVAIVAILASIALPLNELVAQRAKEQDLRRSLREIREAIDAYKDASDEGRINKRPGDSGYPKRLQDLVEGTEDQKSPKKDKIYFLRRIPRDPFAEAGAPPETSWGLRSYESSAAEPRPGKDVYDVYSLSAQKGLNGVAYREW